MPNTSVLNILDVQRDIIRLLSNYSLWSDHIKPVHVYLLCTLCPCDCFKVWAYCMSKKSWTILYKMVLYKVGKDFLGRQYALFKIYLAGLGHSQRLLVLSNFNVVHNVYSALMLNKYI